MATKKVGNKFYVVKKGGKLGKRGYTSAANAQKAQTRGRALSRGISPTRKSPKSSTSASSRAGGASVGTVQRAKAKWGVLTRQARSLLNFLAPAANQFNPDHELVPLDIRLYNTLLNYSGFNASTRSFSWSRPIASWQGMAVSALNDWFDRITRKSSKISRGKVVHILSEFLPAVVAHIQARVPANRPHGWGYGWTFYRSYNKQTTGYDFKDHTWDFANLEVYLGGKAATWVYDKVVPQSWKRTINGLFPKGINPL